MSIIFLSIILLNLIGFWIAFMRQTDSLTDLTYCLSFLVGIWIAYSMNPTIPNLIVAVAITLWACRLGLYLAYRVHVVGGDLRFDPIRNSILLFGSFWLFQAISVFIILLPFTLIFPIMDNINPFYLMTGLTTFMFGFILETIADIQKFKFRQKADVSSFCDEGLWKIIQHPNYLGELICWWSLNFILIPYLSGWLWIGICGPLWITLLITRISGIPPLQDSWKKKYGHLSSFQEYQKLTPRLIPRLTKKLTSK